MLVLSRRESEKILIPELDITIEIVRLQGNTVRVGIDAPSEIRIVRSEVWENWSEESAKAGEPKSSKQDAEPVPLKQPLAAYLPKPKSASSGVVVRESNTGYQIGSTQIGSTIQKAIESANEMIAC